MTQSKLEKQREESREVQAQVQDEWRRHPRATSKFSVPVVNASGDEKDLEVEADGAWVVINTHGEAWLDREAMTRLMKHLQEAFQVVA